MTDKPLNVWMIFQVVAGTEDAARESLDEHIKKLEDERAVSNMESQMEGIEEVDKPHPQIEEGYSRICEVEMDVRTFSELVEIVINYGPTSVDVKSPEEVTMNVKEMRDSLNSVAQMMHRFLQAGVGGMMISRPKEDHDPTGA